MLAEFDRRRSLVVDGLNALPGVSCIVPKGRILRVPKHWADGLEGEGPRLGPPRRDRRRHHRRARFRVHGEGYLRLSYANSAENILRALERMKGFLNSRAGG